MIEVKSIDKILSGEKILENINFSVQKGEIFGLLGPNGAGKTTTMKIITGFWMPSKGEVEIDGEKVSRDSIETRKKIGYLPEQVPLYEDMKVSEYLRFIGLARGLDKKQIKEKILETAKTCGLENVLEKLIDQLSKGYRQRVGLAQAIICDPDILILDEPMTGLDPNQIIEIRDLIKKIGKEKTVIFSSHVLSEVKELCNRIMIINKGQIVGEGSPENLAKESGQKDYFYMKIKGYKDEVLKKLETVQGVDNVKIRDKEADRIYGYEITPEEGKDVREHLSRVVANAGLAILEYYKEESNLEEVFAKLTK